MAADDCAQLGDVVLAEIGGKRRPAVVLRILGDRRLLLVGGTRTKRDRPHVEVEATSRWGRRMGLAADTFFYAPPHVAASAQCTMTGRSCPPELVLKLRELVGLQ